MVRETPEPESPRALRELLLLVGLTLLSIAMTNFPWTWFHAVERPPACQTCGKPVVALHGAPRHPAECACAQPRPVPLVPYYAGSPALVAMSLVLAILIEAFP